MNSIIRGLNKVPSLFLNASGLITIFLMKETTECVSSVNSVCEIEN